MSTITLCVANATYISDCHKQSNHSTSPMLYVGQVNQNSAGKNGYVALFHYRGLMQFAPFTGLPKVGYIHRATLHLYVKRIYGTGDGTTTPTLQIFKNQQEYNAHTVTFEDRPLIGKEPSATIPLRAQSLPGYVTCDLTALFDSWVYDQNPCYGISLMADGPYVVIESPKSANPPYVDIRFESYPLERTPSRDLLVDLNEIPAALSAPTPAPPRPRDFKEIILTADGEHSPYESRLIDTSHAQEVTLMVKNTGSLPLMAHVNISPNGLDFLQDAPPASIAPGEMALLDPHRFAKYARVYLTSNSEIPLVYAKVFCQMQMRV